MCIRDSTKTATDRLLICSAKTIVQKIIITVLKVELNYEIGVMIKHQSLVLQLHVVMLKECSYSGRRRSQNLAMLDFEPIDGRRWTTSAVDKLKIKHC